MNRRELNTIIEILKSGMRLKEEGSVSKIDYVIDTRSMQIDTYVTPIKSVNKITLN